MNLEIVGPIVVGMIVFIVCAVANKFVPRRRVVIKSTCADMDPSPRSAAIHSIKSSLQEIYQQLDSSPIEETGIQKRTATRVLYRCGIASSDIAQHLRMSRGEVELMIQVDRRRVDRVVQELSISEP